MEREDTSPSLQDTQIVPYQPPVLLKEFNESFRTFEIGGKTWRISQDWHQQGVAGVVWEAVSKIVKNQLVVDWMFAEFALIATPSLGTSLFTKGLVLRLWPRLSLFLGHCSL